MEIERKFLLLKLPEIDLGAKIEYKRFFLYLNDGIELRIQQKGEKYELERKIKVDKLSSQKEKIQITKEEFEELKKLSIGGIEREGYLMSLDGQEISIKVYHGIYEGLIRAEVEFATEEQAAKYIPINWFGCEITGAKLGRDRELVKLTKDEFLKEIKKERGE